MIINEFDMLPIDVLQIVFFLLQFEYMLNEKLLQIFVGEIDTELLKTGRKKYT